MADLHGVTLVGGDTCASRSGLVISITLSGEQLPEKVVYRRGATPGDLICVSGTLGDSALGLAELRKGIREGDAVSRHLDPLPRCREGLLLAEAGIPSAMIDLSDGLLADLSHILKLSGAGASLETGKIPLSDYFRDNADNYFNDTTQPALSGGEDYELLFTVSPDLLPKAEKIFSGTGSCVTVVGEITTTIGLQALYPDGKPYMPNLQGFRHF
jgi:thiamine-monophosphate kinase